MTNEELRRRAGNIATACNAALEITGAGSLTEEQREALKAVIVTLYEKARRGEPTPDIVQAYDETLKAIGEPRLTEGQRESLKAFLSELYERVQDDRTGRDQEPPLVG